MRVGPPLGWPHFTHLQTTVFKDGSVFSAIAGAAFPVTDYVAVCDGVQLESECLACMSLNV